MQADDSARQPQRVVSISPPPPPAYCAREDIGEVDAGDEDSSVDHDDEHDDDDVPPDPIPIHQDELASNHPSSANHQHSQQNSAETSASLPTRPARKKTGCKEIMIVYCDVCRVSPHIQKCGDRVRWWRKIPPARDLPTHCEVCGGSIERKPTSDIVEFHCHVCDSDLGRAERLLAHSFVHHGKKPFRCKRCSQQFTRKASMRAHMVKDHHEDNATGGKGKKEKIDD